MSPAGDVNGDGIDDLLIGAGGTDAPGKLNAGRAYLILGKRTATSGAFAAVLDAGNLNGTGGGTFLGAAAGDGAGGNVGWAGDINHDGYNDILIGAASADPAGQSGAGQSYLLYGGPGIATRFDLSGLLAAGGGDGSNGYALNGFQAGAAAGRPNGVGDLNGDGIDDLRVGSPYIDLAGVTAPGQVYVVYGKASRPGIRVMPTRGLSHQRVRRTAQVHGRAGDPADRRRDHPGPHRRRDRGHGLRLVADVYPGELERAAGGHHHGDQ